jgi:hypothetical protein
LINDTALHSRMIATKRTVDIDVAAILAAAATTLPTVDGSGVGASAWLAMGGRCAVGGGSAG